jgi:cupin fold WbuC family metalloprotein
MNKIKMIDKQLLDETAAKAAVSPRRRMNYNFHAMPDDPVNRLLNAMEADTYLRPHRHSNPDKDEIFILLRGRVAILLFDDAGAVTDTVILDPLKGCYGGEIAAGVWHGLVVLESGSVIYEVKQGPYAPLSPGNFAPWATVAADMQSAADYVKHLKQIVAP